MLSKDNQTNCPYHTESVSQHVDHFKPIFRCASTSILHKITHNSQLTHNSGTLSSSITYDCRIVPYGPVWSRKVPYGPLWSHMVLYDPSTLRPTSELSQVYFRHISYKSLAYLRHISFICKANLIQLLAISQAYLN